MKKCIVLDLDNTLWGGVIGEDGIEGIQLSIGGTGAAFIAFQQVLLDLYHRGVILAVCSANNHEDAMLVIRSHPDMILKEHHFAAYLINWQDKAENIRELAQELNIGLDSMVFLDDSPQQRELVRAMLPEVEVPELPADPKDYARFLLSLPYFAASAETDEDAMRGNLYVTERLRRESEKEFETKEAFLKSLGINVHVHEDDTSSLVRLAQLTEKTNQFNTDKHPYTVEELQEFIESPDYSLYHAKVTDRFGDYGITAVALVRKDPEQWFVQSLLMSCRVLGRGVEQAFLSAIAEEAQKQGIERFTVAFTPTEKNAPAKEFLDGIVTNDYVETARLTRPHWIHLTYENLR